MISVIIPVYNGQDHIEEAIFSVKAQTYTDWELIIIDDGSSDRTADILSLYKDDPKIKIFRQKNAGVSAARNKGIELSSGKYIAFLDSDDVWLNNHLSVMAELIESFPNAGLYGSFTKLELVNGKQVSECSYFKDRPETVFVEDFYHEYNIDKSAKMFTMISTCISMEAAKKTGGFPTGCKIGEDLELTLKIAAYYPFVLTKRVTAVYRKSNSTATKDISFEPDWGFFDTVNKIYSDSRVSETKKQNLKKLMDWFSMRRCRHYMINGERKKAFNVFLSLDKRNLSYKDIVITFILMILPYSAVRKLFLVRWRGQA